MLSKEKEVVKLYKTLPIKLTLLDEDKNYWEEQCKHSNSLFNCAIYLIKQHHYKILKEKDEFLTYWVNDEYRTGWKMKPVRGINYAYLCKELKNNKHYKSLPSQVAQQTLKVVAGSITSYNALVKAYFSGEVSSRPRLPGYKKSGGLLSVIFTNQQFKFQNGRVKLAVGKDAKESMICDTWLDVPEFVFSEQIQQIRIRPSRGEWWADFIIDDNKTPVESNTNLNYNRALSIDHGVKFWLSAVTTSGKSFIVEVPQLKTAIWKYQLNVKQYKQGKSNFYWDEHLDKLTGKHNLKVRDAVNKTARFIINRCLKDGIGNLVIGWNVGNKQNINLGIKNNYEVASMPTARLIKRFQELCPEYGIKLFVTSEEYTSKASFVDNDDLPDYGAKPTEWKPSGKRIDRDVYRTKNGQNIHADINAAANILRKVADQLFSMPIRAKIAYEIIKNRALTDPKRYDVFKNLKKKYRNLASRNEFITRVATAA
ncbi:MAG: transposase [Rivularia sp. (in: cyanobacteria)]